MAKCDVKKIWWLASYPKSGNTWVRLFMEAYVAGYCDIAITSGRFVRGDQRPSDFQRVSGWPVSELSPDAMNLMRPAALCNMVAFAEGAEICLKTHFIRGAINYVRMIPAELTLGAVYILRDPRDVAVSMSHHNDCTIDEAIGQLNDKDHALTTDNGLFCYCGNWSQHVRNWTTGKASYPVHTVRYEDLLANPEEEFVKIVEAFGIKPDPERVEVAMRATSFDVLQGQEDAKGFVEKEGGERFFRNGKAGGWRDALTEAQSYRIECAHAGVMREQGYEPQSDYRGSRRTPLAALPSGNSKTIGV